MLFVALKSSKCMQMSHIWLLAALVKPRRCNEHHSPHIPSLSQPRGTARRTAPRRPSGAAPRALFFINAKPFDLLFKWIYHLKILKIS